MANNGDLRVWHIANPPNRAFHVPVGSPRVAAMVLVTLWGYDAHLGDLISSNASGLELFEDGEWTEWHNEDGDSIVDSVLVHSLLDNGVTDGD